MTQAWEIIEDEDGSVLVLNVRENGDIIGILLENKYIKELRKNPLAELHYEKELNFAHAELISRAGSNPN